MLDFDYLKSICDAQQLPFSPELAEKLDRYAQMLVEWNEKINLTAITEPGDIAVKHFADSLLLLKACDIPQNARIIDVGTGAGFPSVPVCLARPDLRLTLLDSLQKRITFLNQLCTALSLPADCVHGRAEETGRKPEYREQFDLATARAVANLRELAEYCLPFVRVGGTFAALKGYDVDQELDEARYAISQLGSQVEDVRKFRLREDASRAIVLIKKVRPVSAKYPRISAKIKKSPLIGR